MSFCLKVSSCHSRPPENNLITNDLGQMPLLPHKQTYTHKLQETSGGNHCNYCDCDQIALCLWLLMPLVCVWRVSAHSIGRKDRAIHHSLTSSVTRANIICHVSGRMKGSLSRKPNGWIIFKKCPIDFTGTLHALHTILCVHNKITTVT